MFSIFFIVFAAIGIGMFLAFVATRKRPPQSLSLVPPEEDFTKSDSTKRPLTLEDLYKVGEKLCVENHLRIKEKMTIHPNEVYWVTESTNEFFFGNYVLGFHTKDSTDEYVTLPKLLEFKDFIKSVSSTKGFFFTTEFFTRDVHQPLEGPKVSLYNQLKVWDEMKRFNLGS